MSSFKFKHFAKQLPEVQSDLGISFESQQRSWDTADDVKDVVSALENKKVVHYLNLDGNTLGVEAAAAIGKALESHPEFRKALWKNMFTRRLKTEIPQALKHLGNGLMVAGAQLVILDLSDNALGPNGMVGLEVLLRSSVCYSLQELRLNNCGLGIGGGEMLSKAMIDCYNSSVAAGTPLQLKVFIAGRNRLENDGAKAIGKMFATLKTLEEITMPQNSIYHAGIAALSDGIKENTNLKVLNLNDNIITPTGAQFLADILSFIPNLREINFGDCLLKTDGAYLFSDALTDKHLDLEIVDLSFNDINADGGELLVKAMLNKPNLKTLNLDGNHFGTKGLEFIMETMLSALNPKALVECEENDSEDEDDENENADEEDYQDNESVEYDTEEDYEEQDEEEEEDDHHNDTTEEVDEDDDVSEESAYTTTNGFPTLLHTNDSLISKGINGVSQPVEPKDSQSDEKEGDDDDDDDDVLNPEFFNNLNPFEKFNLSPEPCSLEMFEEAIKVPDMDFIGFCEAFKQTDISDYADQLVFTTLKCANLSLSSPIALKWAIELFVECFKYAIENKLEKIYVSYLGTQLGLIKHTCGFESLFDGENCCYALKESLKRITNETLINGFNDLFEKAKQN